MPDLEKLIQIIEKALEWVFGGQVPSWAFLSLGYVLLAAVALLGIYGLLLILGKIKKVIADEFLDGVCMLLEQVRTARR
jgi:hypothetical protein